LRTGSFGSGAGGLRLAASEPVSVVIVNFFGFFFRLALVVVALLVFWAVCVKGIAARPWRGGEVGTTMWSRRGRGSCLPGRPLVVSVIIKSRLVRYTLSST